MRRRSFGLGLSAAVAAAVLVSGLSIQIAQAQWKPDKPITIIVPWAAGGSTDQVTRLAAVEIEKALNQKVVIVNQGATRGDAYAAATLDAPLGQVLSELVGQLSGPAGEPTRTPRAAGPR